jgi:hypothetical protein
MSVGPVVNKTTLQNGVRIVSRAMPHVRSVSMGVWVHAGARDEADAEKAVALSESIASSFEDTGKVIEALFGQFEGADFQTRNLLEKQIREENERRDKVLEMQKKMNMKRN